MVKSAKLTFLYQKKLYFRRDIDDNLSRYK